MNLYENQLYNEDIRKVCSLDLPWEKFNNKRIIVSGATGLIGSFLIDVLLEKKLGCTIYALGRNEQKAKERFSKFHDNENLIFVHYDVKDDLYIEGIEKADFVLHLASNTHPIQYATEPIGTITTNIIGLKNMLDFSVLHGAERFVFASSNEIYGENREDTELFDEEYCGYINCNTLRAGYPESKRCGEALCQAYKAEKRLDVIIPRFTRTYGPTMQMSDSKAISQFIKKGVASENIILKSEGKQYYSYTYVADAVSGLLTIILLGENGEAYNIADITGDIMMKDLANLIAKISGTKVDFNIPDVIEAAGYSKATKARLSGEKLRQLGWVPFYDITTGIKRTIDILKE